MRNADDVLEAGVERVTRPIGILCAAIRGGWQGKCETQGVVLEA